jgi:hypothetical protein
MSLPAPPFIRIDPYLDLIEIDGIRFSRGFFAALAHPDENALYRIKRDGEVVHIEMFRAEKAKLNDPLLRVLKRRGTPP